ncbi:hypothetical protein [Lactobacillus alimentarius DSM 20249] [Lactiplantibacillus mudanjiangensis]|nr:hypothetical protein [Lactobacillus alimentarius DSM 20249] [Lactiplantibacillus mudanjiangensis]VDG25910.1 hypothetical protein [Lactobacillus alimentarius DSM 20249] [Lactiplantibacillus mudanjiangensis]
MLRQETSKEKYYRTHPGILGNTYQNIEKISFKGQKVFLFKLPTLNKNIIQIRKDSRYTNVPKYIHTNINLNYVYSGECTYLVDGQKLVLHKGDVCLFDTNVIRSKERLSKNDIIINISLSHTFFSGEFIDSLQNQNIIYKWLLIALSSRQNSHDNFILFKTAESPKIISLFHNVLEEYYAYTPFSVSIINAYMQIIFVELVRTYDHNKNGQLLKIDNKIVSNNFIEILQYTEHYADKITLTELGKKFGYSPNYIADIIKISTGKTFSDIKKGLRLKKAANLLITTDKKVEEIIETIGISNKSFFYTAFKDYYHLSPARYRKINR